MDAKIAAMQYKAIPRVLYIDRWLRFENGIPRIPYKIS